MVDAADAVAIKEMRAPRVEEQVAVTPEEPRSRPCHLQHTHAGGVFSMKTERWGEQGTVSVKRVAIYLPESN